MAPATASPSRRKARENQYFDLGVRGRKTGLTLPDTGIRDEHGLEPMDHLFSSPEKPKSTKPRRNGISKNANSTISAEEDMDTGDSTVPDPATILADRRRASMKMPLPRSKSPMKTYLNSPAKRGPSLGVPSPTRAIIPPRSSSVTTSVRRRLNFAGADHDPTMNSGSPSILKQGSSKLFKSTHLKPSALVDFSDDDDDDAETQYQDDQPVDMVGEGDDGLDDAEEEQLVERDSPARGTIKDMRQPIPEIVAPVKAKGKAKRGRPKKQLEPNDNLEAAEGQEESEAEESRPPKRPRRSLDAVAAPKGKEKAKAKGTAGSSKAAKAQKAGRKPQLASIAENSAESPEIERRPPLPGRNRGLFILRRETPGLGSSSFKQTRSGRNSIKPLAWWAGERTELEASEIFDGKQKLIVNSIKEVVRADEVEKPQRRANSRSGYDKSRSKSKAPKEPESEEEELEPWEMEPGQISGLVREWDPDDPAGRNAEEVETLLAYSANAVETRVVATGDFKFAKTLSTPFFGAGFVDLEPGTYKKPKNTRRMQMVFLVVSGRVLAMVNNNSFRIGKGGQWMVPRGNFYSIENDTDQPARIFFCQGNEVAEGHADMSAVAGPSTTTAELGNQAE